MLAGRGSSSVGAAARWRVGLAPAASGGGGGHLPTDSPDGADDDGIGGDPNASSRPGLEHVASLERPSQKVEFVLSALERHIEECSQQSTPHMAVLGPLPSTIASPKAVWR